MKKIILFSLILLSSLYLPAQELTLPELTGFKKITNYPVFTPENLWDFINGAADNYLALGFVNLHVAEYKKGKDVIKLEVYRHKDNTLAFGIYSSERSPSFRFMNLGTQGYSADGSTNFYKGVYYVKIRTYSKKEKTLQSSYSLAQQVANMLPGEASLPRILTLFPGEGKKINEETYINESVLGHGFLNNAFRSNYNIGPDDFSIYILEKGSSAEARQTINAYLKETGMDAQDDEEGKVMLNDGYNETIFLAWKGNMVVLISGLSKDQTDIANRYTSDILK